MTIIVDKDQKFLEDWAKSVALDDPHAGLIALEALLDIDNPNSQAVFEYVSHKRLERKLARSRADHRITTKPLQPEPFKVDIVYQRWGNTLMKHRCTANEKGYFKGRADCKANYSFSERFEQPTQFKVCRKCFPLNPKSDISDTKGGNQ